MVTEKGSPTTDGQRTHATPDPRGTLVWVGDRELDEFVEAYRYCEANASQVAYRRDVRELINRPAAAVRRIIFARSTRNSSEESTLGAAIDDYPAALGIQLLGPLVPGEPQGRIAAKKLPRVHWHQAAALLPYWLTPCGQPVRATQSVRSVAVIAADAAAAEPWLDLAASAGVVAIWCRKPDSFRVRNVEVVWWDDSAAPPVTPTGWADRLDAVSAAGSAAPQRHAWLVNSPHIEHCRSAIRAGVETIVAKPGRIETLLEMLSPINASTPVSSSAAKAA